MSSDTKVGLTLASILGIVSVACLVSFVALFDDSAAWALWAVGMVGLTLTAKVINDITRGPLC